MSEQKLAYAEEPAKPITPRTGLTISLVKVAKQGYVIDIEGQHWAFAKDKAELQTLMKELLELSIIETAEGGQTPTTNVESKQ